MEQTPTDPGTASTPPSPVPVAGTASILGSIAWVFVVLCCIAGIYVTRALSAAHAGVHSPGLLGSMCSPERGEGINCDQVLQSPWSTLKIKAAPPPTKAKTPAATTMPQGKERDREREIEIPYAWIGMGYFAALGVWFLFVGRPSYSRRVYHLIPLLIVVPGFGGSLGFLYILAYKLPVLCPLCIATHAINFLILIGTLLMWPRRKEAGPTVHPTFQHAAAAAVLMILAAYLMILSQRYAQAAGGMDAYQKRLMEYETNPELQWEITKNALIREEPVSIPVDPDDPVWGPPSAGRTLILFSDFQCPACKKMHDTLMSLWPKLQQAAAAKGGVRLIFKHYPLYSPCNARVQTSMHAFSCDAARAAEAARIVGGPDAFWKMAHLMYSRQDELFKAPYNEWAKEIGLDVAAFEKALRSEEVAQRIQRHVEQAFAVRLRGTPSLYLDGISIKKIGGAGEKIWRMILSSPVWPPTRKTFQ